MCKHYKKKKIKNVYYSFEDPDIRTFKKAKKFFKSKGIKCKLIPTKKYSKFYKSYFINKKFSIPMVTAKIAISKDYLTINKRNKWITNNTSRNLVHLLRSRHDCILSTSKTINHDDSILNCRIDGLKKNQPDLFIIDLNLKLKKKLSLNMLLDKRKTFLITTIKDISKTTVYKKLGYKILLIDRLKNKNDFQLLLKRIYKIGYSRILTETGLTFLNALIKNKIIHDLYIFKSYKNLGKRGKNNETMKYLKNIFPNLLTINLNGDKLLKKEF